MQRNPVHARVGDNPAPAFAAGNSSPSSRIVVGDFARFIFIVGAPRCGTTTLSQFLKSHPSIASPVVKEPHFFSKHDLRGLSRQELQRVVEREYLGRFFARDPERRIGLDASVTSLYAPEQLEPVLRLWPRSQFIVALRDPMTMLPSLHRRLIYTGDETIGTFDDAWAALADRRAGRRIPSRCADERFLLYDEACRYATYLERLYASVGRTNCHVVLFDDLAQDPAQEYNRLMGFLGLEPQPDVDFAPQRVSYGVRFQWLQRLLKRPPAAAMRYLAGEKLSARVRNMDEPDAPPAPGAILALRKRLIRWNRIAPQNDGPSPETLQEIRRGCSDEIQRLETLLGRDLSHWLDLERAGPRRRPNADPRSL